jgi:hypothetical protein
MTVVQVYEPGLEVTVYLVIVDPPLYTGAIQLTTDWVLPLDVALTFVGASGIVDGVALADAAAPTPLGLIAKTEKTYVEPLTSPLMRHDVFLV